MTKSVALTLGGGGARGLAHIAALEALDEMGVKPKALSGTSIGAVFAAAYAAGMSGKDIHQYVVAMAKNRTRFVRRLISARARVLPNLFAGFRAATLLDAEKLCGKFLPAGMPQTFEELDIPLIVVASDLYRRDEAVFSSGPLVPALAASIAIPGLMRPMRLNGRILVDGGATNPLPFEHLRGRADIVAAVDISGAPPAKRTEFPNAWECVYASVLVMSHTITAEKLKRTQPDLLIQPGVGAFRVLDFHRANAILRAAEPTKAVIMQRLGVLLGR
jgi:NTE family protein